MTNKAAELALDYPAWLIKDFPAEAPAAIRAVDAVLAAISGTDSFAPLEKLSPGLQGNDWSIYLRCSQIRMAHAMSALRRHGVTSGRVLDYGAYFGNFSLQFQEAGFAVDAVDAYSVYGDSLAPAVDLLRQRGIQVYDVDTVGRDLAGLDAGAYDVVLCMGVIEHVPHTPRVLLEAVNRVLKTGGVLVMDTPNVAQLHNRQQLAQGHAIMTPLTIQYHATVPFEGHHREYTVEEMVWMVQAAGHRPLACELFNYSAYAHERLSGRDVTNHWRTVANPDMRELIMVASQKTGSADDASAFVDWRTVFHDGEHYWADRLPRETKPESGSSIVTNELQIKALHEAVVLRDRMLAELQAERNEAVLIREHELVRRDHEIARLHQECHRQAVARIAAENIGLGQSIMNKLGAAFRRRLGLKPPPGIDD